MSDTLLERITGSGVSATMQDAMALAVANLRNQIPEGADTSEFDACGVKVESFPEGSMVDGGPDAGEFRASVQVGIERVDVSEFTTYGKNDARAVVGTLPAAEVAEDLLWHFGADWIEVY